MVALRSEQRSCGETVTHRLPVRMAALVGLVVALAGCNTPPPVTDPEARAEYFETNDPWEPTNRVIHVFNDGLDTLVLRPAAEIYRIFVPPPIRAGIGNVLDNLQLPRSALYALMQGNTKVAADNAARFVINTTLGVGGIVDIAADMGIQGRYEDFGQNIAVWAGTTNGGPYVVLPVFGPSNVRDAFGRGVDLFTDPWAYLIGMEAQLVRTAVSTVDSREALIEPLDALRASSLDYYAALRSTYLQQRERDIRNEGSFQRRFFNWEGDTRPARQR